MTVCCYGWRSIDSLSARLTPRHLDSPARQLWLPPAPAVWRDQNETRSHVWRDLKVRKRYIILNYGCLHSLCQQPWATKTPVPFSSFKQLVSTYIACWNTLSRKLRYCTGWTQPIRGLHSSPMANKRLRYTHVYPVLKGVSPMATLSWLLLDDLIQ